MPVISNTSPLLNLAIINQLSLIKEQFREIIIPNAVLKELRINEDIPGSSQLREALDISKNLDFSPVIQAFEVKFGRGLLEADWIIVKISPLFTRKTSLIPNN